MILNRYQYHPRDLLIEGSGELQLEDLRRLTEAVFRAWTRDIPSGKDPSDELELRGVLRKRTEGQSEADVWDLAFCRS